MDKDYRKHRDIDGGYAWVILVAAFLCHGLAAGTSEIFGILYVEILDEYQVGKYLTSWIITLQTVSWGLTGRYIIPLVHIERPTVKGIRHGAGRMRAGGKKQIMLCVDT